MTPTLLVGLVGTALSGKRTLATRLHATHGFTVLEVVASQGPEPEPEPEPEQGTWIRLTEAQLVGQVSRLWHRNVVVFPIREVGVLDSLRLKPNFCLVGLDAPFPVRLGRMRAGSMEDLAAQDREMKLTLHTSPCDWVLNNDTDLPELDQRFAQAHCQLLRRLRPDWDTYFMELAILTARRSSCMKRRVGCVLVASHRVISTGYNGTPVGMLNCRDGGCERCNSCTPRGKKLDECLCLHAEENALLEAGRDRAAGTTLYTTLCPCLSCAKRIVQCGVTRVVYRDDYASDEIVRRMLEGVNIFLVRYVC